MKYSFVLNENGGILDDLVLYKMEDGIFFVPNASTTEKIYEWFKEKSVGYDVEVENVSNKYICFAIQGQKAEVVLQKIINYDLKKIKFFCFFEIDDMLISRSGYTGEDGFEIIANVDNALELWEKIMNAGKEEKIKPCGLGARDSLRIEKGFLLSGQDFDEERTPVETNAFWAVKLDHDFIGKKKTIEKMNEKHDVFVGIEMVNGIPRKGFEIYNSSLIGHITSGTYSPILKKGIGLGYVASGYENVGTNVKVLIRGKKEYGRIVKLPFV